MTPAASISTSTLHLLGRFEELYTGAEKELLDLRALVAGRRPVKLWSDMPVNRAYAGEGVTALQPFAHQYPKDGTLLVGGAHLKPEVWLKYTKFDRVIVLHNLSHQPQLFAIVEGLRAMTGKDPEIVSVSRMLHETAALPSTVIPSLIALEPFLSVAAKRFDKPRAADAPFTIGRASRDFLGKHNPADLSLYKMLATHGVRVRIMGGTCLAPGLGGFENIELLPAGAETMPDFYASLDAMFYRTGEFIESYGRVVLEGMASGLPVVAHDAGGYAERIDDGVSGFLIRSPEQAYDALMRLKASPVLVHSVGLAARDKAIAVHGPEAAERDLAFYLK